MSIVYIYNILFASEEYILADARCYSEVELPEAIDALMEGNIIINNQDEMSMYFACIDAIAE